jgi:hypothetical protein
MLKCVRYTVVGLYGLVVIVLFATTCKVMNAIIIFPLLTYYVRTTAVLGFLHKHGTQCVAQCYSTRVTLYNGARSPQCRAWPSQLQQLSIYWHAATT